MTKVIIKTDQNGDIVIPKAMLGDTARFSTFEVSLEPVMQTQPSSLPASERIARFNAWIAASANAPALPLEATNRDSIYD
jgi:hypothetical protein